MNNNNITTNLNSWGVRNTISSKSHVFNPFSTFISFTFKLCGGGGGVGSGGGGGGVGVGGGGGVGGVGMIDGG